jgi:4-hydroxybenzoate polyprenyltransferase
VERAVRRERTLRRYLEFVRFEHTLFALPFAYGGMLLAAGGWPGFGIVVWVTLAMVGARTAAMALNRVIDARIDASNPRTSGREIPSGRLGRRDGVVLALLGFGLLALAGWSLNPLTLALLPVAVLFLAVYPYTKRFTWLCHLWLGLTIGAAAAGGWIAVTGAFAPAAVALWAGVGLWIAGFDIVYALLDEDFDRAHGVRSIPARFGRARALTIAAALHLGAWIALALPLPLLGLGWAYGLSVLLVGWVLLYQHREVRRGGVEAALRGFNANLIVGGLMLVGIVLDLAL